MRNFISLRSSKLYSAVAVLLACILLVTGCSGSTTSGGEASADGTLELSIMTITPSATPAADDNVIKQAIEKATHSKMHIQWVANNVYKEKLNLTLASGDIPDLIMVNDPFASTFTTMVNQGVFWNLTPYYKDYPTW